MVVNEETRRRSLKHEHTTELLAPFRKRPTLVQRAAAFTCDALDSYLSWWSGKKGQLFLEGAFAPVAEGDLVEDLPVEGELPVSLPEAIDLQSALLPMINVELTATLTTCRG